MYSVYLNILFAEIHKVLKPGGRVTIATWCLSEELSNEVWVDKINQHYDVLMHTSDDYEKTLNQYFKNITKYNYSDSAIDYFKIRSNWLQKSEVEPYYIFGLESKKLQYLFIVAEK